jgi:protein-disulfide isomerase
MEKAKILTILVLVTLVLSLINLVATFDINLKMKDLTGKAVANNNNLPTGTGNTVQTVVDASAGNSPVLGQSSAPVTIIEFSDYQCPYCGRFETDTYPQLKTDYIDTGKVKLVFRNFPLSFHENAQNAAEAAECANEQGKFWAYNENLFAKNTALTVTNLKQYAKDLGLDTTKFDQCLDSGKMKSVVQKDVTDATSYGVSGTPTFYINGVELVGAQPISAFKQVIDAALAK